MGSTVPLDVNLYENRAPQVYAAQITVYALAIIAVALRLVSKRVSKAPYGWDDWFILMATVTNTGLFAIVILCLKSGLGKHILVVVFNDPTAPTAMLKLLLAGEFVYSASITFIKYSILVFYWRIFGVAGSMRISIYVLTGFIGAWVFAVIVTSSLTCIPLAAFWDLSIKGQCIDIVKFYIGNTILNVVTDISVLVLPLPYIWRLHVATPQKIIVAAAFIMGGLTCVVSIIRTAFIVRLDLTDLTWGATNLGLYTGLEVYCGIICACLPSLRPLLSLPFKKSLSSSRRSIKRGTRPSISTPYYMQNKMHRYPATLDTDTGSLKALSDDVTEPTPWAPTASVYADREGIELDQRNMDMKGISVETKVVWDEV